MNEMTSDELVLQLQAEVERLTAEANKSWEELRKSDAEVERLRKMADDASVEAFEARETLRESRAEVERLRAGLEQMHPQGAHDNFRIVGQGPNGGNMWATVSDIEGCRMCALLGRVQV